MVHHSLRRGVARRNVVVAVVIVTLLAGLIVTGIMRVRELAGRSSSTNNLKQIGLGFHSHNDTAYYLPFNGGHTDPDKLKEMNYGWHNPNFRDTGTWAMMIHPFMECDPLYRSVVLIGESNDKVPGYLSQTGNNADWQVTFKYYVCPDRARLGYKTSSANGSMPGVVTDYAINVFLNDPPRTYTAVGEPMEACFALSGGLASAANSRMTIQGIFQGANNCIMVGGKALSPKLAASLDANHGDEGIFSPGHYTAAGADSKVISTGTGRGHRIDPAMRLNTDQDVNPASGGVPWMHRDSELYGSTIPDFASDWGGPFKSGVLFLFADGTVRSVPYDLRGTVQFARMLYAPQKLVPIE
ncbi:hypothetical protein BH11PLA2_BH11PLA2_21800 [soil metagenome]